MVSEETNSNLRGSRPYVLLDSFDNLENEIALLRDCIENLSVTNSDLIQEIQELNQGLNQINQRLDNTPTAEEEVQVQAQPVEPEQNNEYVRPLEEGDRVRITSRNLFGIEGTVLSFTNSRVRVRVANRRQPVLRKASNLERIN